MKEFKEYLNNYDIVNPPHGLNHHNWNKDQGIEHFAWMMASLPERINQLEGVVNSNPPEVNFVADFSRDSLHKLDEWLKENVTFVYFSEGDRENMKKSIDHEYLKHSAEEIVPKYRLSAQNMSLAFDIGTYLGEVFRTLYPEKVRWICNSKTRKDGMDYLLPTLVGTSKFNSLYHLNPFAPAHVISLKYLRGDYKKFSLYGMIDKWISRFGF